MGYGIMRVGLARDWNATAQGRRCCPNDQAIFLETFQNRRIVMGTKVRRIVKRFVADESGLETVEYAIITGLIVAGTITVIAAIGLWVKAQFDALDLQLSPPPPGP